MSKIITGIWNFLNQVYAASWASWGIVIATTMVVLTWGKDGVEFVFGKIPGLVSASGSLTNPGSQALHYIGLVDTFVPLHESIAFAGAYMQVLVAALLIRVAKSWVPTVSG